jgi:hypothetical protein
MKTSDSPFWKGLMKVKDEFFSRGSFDVGNGEDTRFWEDAWLGNKPLAVQYPYLYNIVQRKNVSVAIVLNQNPLNIAFCRTLTGNRWDMLLHLVQRLINVELTNERHFHLEFDNFWDIYC